MLEEVKWIDVPGGRVWAKRVGNGASVPVVVLHGGPGSSHDYLTSLEGLADERPLIFYDQLGSGLSDRPDDRSLWRVERFVRELEHVLDAFAIERAHIFGHSWGTMLGLEFAALHPEKCASLIMASPCLSMRRVRADMVRLKAQLPSEIRHLLKRCEASGDTYSPDFQAANIAFHQQFVSRGVRDRELVERMGREINGEVYRTMWGPAEFCPAGNLAFYEGGAKLAQLRIPTLFTCGRHDEMTPESTAFYHENSWRGELAIFESSSHLPHIEEQESYLHRLRAFLET